MNFQKEPLLENAETPTSDNILLVPSMMSKSGPPSPSIARPRPNSRTLQMNQVTNTQSGTLSECDKKLKPAVPPRPNLYSIQRAKSVEMGNLKDSSSQLISNQEHKVYNKDLISLSPVNRTQTRDLDFELSMLDPLSNDYKIATANVCSRNTDSWTATSPSQNQALFTTLPTSVALPPLSNQHSSLNDQSASASIPSTTTSRPDSSPAGFGGESQIGFSHSTSPRGKNFIHKNAVCF